MIHQWNEDQNSVTYRAHEVWNDTIVLLALMIIHWIIFCVERRSERNAKAYNEEASLS